jgi:hypothetical protein
MTRNLALILVDAHIAAVASVALRVAAGRGRRQRRDGAINVTPRLRGVGLWACAVERNVDDNA